MNKAARKLFSFFIFTLLFLLISCTNSEAKNYSITVTNGTGSGTYENGASVTIQTEVPEYKVFEYWECDGENVSKENPYTFTASKNQTFTAIFKAEQAVVTVNYGTGSGTYDKGSAVTLSATVPTNKEFDYWAVSGNSISSENPYTFTVTEDITITAMFKKMKSEITVVNGTGGGSVTKNSTITITADKAPTNMVFDYWECDGENVSTSSVYTFTASIDATYTAIYKDIIKNRGEKKLDATDIEISSTTVSDGGTLIIDYKYLDVEVDESNSISIYLGSDENNCFGEYKLFVDHLEKDYAGITFTTLYGGYNRIVIDVKELNNVDSKNNAPTIINKIILKSFNVTKGVYIDTKVKQSFVKSNTVQVDKDDVKIINFGDIHINELSLLDDTQSTGKTIKYAVANSNPDIIVLSGDIAGNQAKLASVCEYFDCFGVPYFFALGNHDNEGNLGYTNFANVVNQSKYGYIEKGPNNLANLGNYTVTIKNKDDKIIHTLIVMNSGNEETLTDDSKVEYVQKTIYGVKYGEYNNQATYSNGSSNGMKEDQINWYEDVVEGLECETTLIMHIPFIEYCKAYEVYQNAKNRNKQDIIDECAPIGKCTMEETISCSYINYGFFEKIKELGSTLNVLCGHDHCNDYSLMYEGVRLTFALKTGECTYWKKDGSRNGYTEITLNSEGHASLDQIYFNPLY